MKAAEWRAEPTGLRGSFLHCITEIIQWRNAMAKLNSATLWDRTKLNGYFRLALLSVSAIIMAILSTFPTPLALKALRFFRMGAPFDQKLVVGAALDPVAALLCIVTATVSLAAVAWGYTKLAGWLEDRRVTEFERQGSVSRCFVGVLFGIIVIAASMGIMFAAGAASFGLGQNFVMSSSTIVPVLVVPVLEELIFRGVLFRILEEMFGTLIGLIVSSVLFGAAHLLNDNATMLAASFLSIELGALLAVAYVITRSLWLPIGLHAGWNFALGNIFGAADSGTIVQGLLETKTSGHAILSGGAFGPEASIITLSVSVLVLAPLIRHARSAGHWRPAPRSIKA
jgi:membrane protease YdiL (CAAX protease family)